ncbi:histidinol-phosphatase [Nitratifractor sp.]
MVIDLHNHTPLCNHAEGSPEAYVETALSQGVDIFGFADHAPMDFDPEYRMGFAQMEEYERTVRDLAERYKGRIEILLGYEVDYLPGHMDERVLHASVDYLIGSVHFLDGWGFDNPEFIGRYEGADLDEIWRRYFDAVAAMARSKLFDIVGHLDLIKVFNYRPRTDVRTLAEGALDAIAAVDMVLELNAAGWRKPVGEPYPSLDLLRMAHDRGIAITFASDAHKPEQVGYRRDELCTLAREAGYTRAASFRNRERRMHKI